MTREEDLQLHRENVAKVKRPILWERICDRVSSVVTSHNALYATPEFGLTAFKIAAEINCENGHISLRKVAFPQVKVLVEMPAKRLIKIDYTYQKADLANAVSWSDCLDFKVDDRDNIHLLHQGDPINVDDAVQLIVKPLRDPAFSPPGSSR
ncbi:MAG: hypothetical protein JO138_10515 [Acidobacteriaceae bacterium]|nr:hypothetical protein [Acidobacteriaceae bacterium]